MRAYTVATAAVTLQVSPKWLDNLLSHHTVPGVARSRQGVSRRLTEQAILTVEVANRISRNLSIPAARSLELAQHLTRGSSTFQAGEGITLSLDLRSIQATVAERLAYAVEIAPIPQRGRPPQP